MQNSLANHFSKTSDEIEPKTPTTTLQGGETSIRFIVAEILVPITLIHVKLMKPDLLLSCLTTVSGSELGSLKMAVAANLD